MPLKMHSHRVTRCLYTLAQSMALQAIKEGIVASSCFADAAIKQSQLHGWKEWRTVRSRRDCGYHGEATAHVLPRQALAADWLAGGCSTQRFCS